MPNAARAEESKLISAGDSTFMQSQVVALGRWVGESNHPEPYLAPCQMIAVLAEAATIRLAPDSPPEAGQSIGPLCR